jgi:hypothetical protein
VIKTLISKAEDAGPLRLEVQMTLERVFCYYLDLILLFLLLQQKTSFKTFGAKPHLYNGFNIPKFLELLRRYIWDNV